MLVKKVLALCLVTAALAATSHASSEVRNLKTVLRGAMLRSGGPANRTPMGRTGLQELCSQHNVSDAIYLYAKDWNGPTSVSCGSQTTQYQSLDFRGAKRAILQKVHSAIMNPGRGPVLVHCWNGLHAAGEISAIALRQLCGYSADQAVAYWQANVPSRDRDAYPLTIKAIRNYAPTSDLAISGSAARQVCP